MIMTPAAHSQTLCKEGGRLITGQRDRHCKSNKRHRNTREQKRPQGNRPLSWPVTTIVSKWQDPSCVFGRLKDGLERRDNGEKEPQSRN